VATSVKRQRRRASVSEPADLSRPTKKKAKRNARGSKVSIRVSSCDVCYFVDGAGAEGGGAGRAGGILVDEDVDEE
jgi:hypothetical protein